MRKPKTIIKKIVVSSERKLIYTFTFNFSLIIKKDSDASSEIVVIICVIIGLVKKKTKLQPKSCTFQPVKVDRKT